tara:strand:- start:1688 stop:1975 length:288 start_codon:yes stop_codon:yes gene_type:complete
MRITKKQLKRIIREEVLREEIEMKDELAKMIQRLGVKDSIQMSKITSALKDPSKRDATENKAFADLFFAILANPDELQTMIPLIKKASAESEKGK